MSKRSERRRRHRRAVEKAQAIRAVEVFEQRARVQHREGEKLVCLACRGRVKKVKGLKGVPMLRCTQCDRETTEEAFQEALRELERAGQRAESGGDAGGASEAPDRRVILTDDLQPPSGAAGLYLPGDFAQPGGER